ncbi:hypothetical protein, partial [Amycolatopsis mediterranei]|uniref:hypothetical protein n=1 Tax=Amycolatopsis mediterranei TaxID=33910 RepID=UPI003D9EE3B7
MRDDVVHLPGDPQPLRRNRLLGMGFPLDRGVLAAAVDGDAERSSGSGWPAATAAPKSCGTWETGS